MDRDKGLASSEAGGAGAACAGPTGPTGRHLLPETLLESWALPRPTQGGPMTCLSFLPSTRDIEIYSAIAVAMDGPAVNNDAVPPDQELLQPLCDV